MQGMSLLLPFWRPFSLAFPEGAVRIRTDRFHPSYDIVHGQALYDTGVNTAACIICCCSLKQLVSNFVGFDDRHPFKGLRGAPMSVSSENVPHVLMCVGHLFAYRRHYARLSQAKAIRLFATLWSIIVCVWVGAWCMRARVCVCVCAGASLHACVLACVDSSA